MTKHQQQTDHLCIGAIKNPAILVQHVQHRALIHFPIDLFYIYMQAVFATRNQFMIINLKQYMSVSTMYMKLLSNQTSRD